MQSSYTAYLSHHSIARSQTISTVQSSVCAAKRSAWNHFKGQQRDYKIILKDNKTGKEYVRKMNPSEKWQDIN